jgi:GNAT superfamily N-acetyltransferase
MIKASDPNAIRIVLATTEDWDRVRAVRLRALADAPLAYESRWEEEKDRPESFWRGRLERQDAATFLAQADNEAVGLARAFVVPENPAHTELVSMWVAPEARGRCIGRQLVGAVVGWGAATRGHERGIVGDRDERSGSKTVRVVWVHVFGRATTAPVPPRAERGRDAPRSQQVVVYREPKKQCRFRRKAQLASARP